MHVDDGARARFFATEIEEGEQAAGVVSVPVRNHNALDRGKGRAKPGKVARQRLRFWTSVEECEARRCVGGLLSFLMTFTSVMLYVSVRLAIDKEMNTIRAEKPCAAV
jgi:hypothetical protein